MIRWVTLEIFTARRIMIESVLKMMMLLTMMMTMTMTLITMMAMITIMIRWWSDLYPAHCIPSSLSPSNLIMALASIWLYWNLIVIIIISSWSSYHHDHHDHQYHQVLLIKDMMMINFFVSLTRCDGDDININMISRLRVSTGELCFFKTILLLLIIIIFKMITMFSHPAISSRSS